MADVTIYKIGVIKRFKNQFTFEEFQVLPNQKINIDAQGANELIFSGHSIVGVKTIYSPLKINDVLFPNNMSMLTAEVGINQIFTLSIPV
jgi:hypothetical protein